MATDVKGLPEIAPLSNRTPMEQFVSSAVERPDTRGPQYGSSGKLTYDSAVQTLRSGGSIVHNGNHIGSVNKMPSRAAWADSDEDRKAARELLERERYDLKQKIAEADALSRKSDYPRDPAWTDEEYEAFLATGTAPKPAAEGKPQTKK